MGFLGCGGVFLVCVVVWFDDGSSCEEMLLLLVNEFEVVVVEFVEVFIGVSKKNG